MIAERLRIAVLAGAALALLPPAADLSAQYSEAPPAAAYALRAVTVVGPDGARREGMTLVVRDGLLASVSADTTVPADARVLEGDSLFVYPGLVDAEGEPRFEFAAAAEGEGGEEEQEEEVPGWNPPRDAQGFQPHRRAADALTATGDDLEGAREAGVVASAAHPSNGLAPGRGVLLLHRMGTDASRKLVVRPVLGPVLAFDGAEGYPETLMGVMAFLRQQFADAGHHASLVSAHATDPRGMTGFGWDPDLEVLSRAAAGETRVFFRADRAEDIRRVLELSGELGFRPVIVGGEEAWQVADRLAAAQVPVLVSLDFPTPQRWDPDEDADEPEGEAPPDTTAGEEAEPPAEDAAGVADRAEAADTAGQEELDPEVLREKRHLEDIYSNAGRLHEAGVRLALTSGGGEADLLEGTRRAVEYGLPEAAALRALTATPAELLGAPWLNRMGQGRAATFLVTDGPLLDEGTEILNTFVEGRLQRGAEPGREPEEPPAADLTGSWDMEVEGSMGSFDVDLRLKQQRAEFEGTATGTFGALDVVDGLVSGTDVSFTVVADMGGETAELSFTGTVEGDSMSGSGSGPPQMGSFSWEATRSGGPGGGSSPGTGAGPGAGR